MSYSIPPHKVERAIAVHFAETFSEVSSDAWVWPRMVEDMTQGDEWVSPYFINDYSRVRQRKGSGGSQKHQAEFQTVVHCYVKPTTDTQRVLVIASAVAQVFDQRVIQVYDYDNSSSLMGSVRFDEAEELDLTEGMQENYQDDSQHAVVTIAARVYGQ